MGNLTRKLLLVFLMAVNASVFSQEAGKLTLEIRATEEMQDPGNYWYYAYFTSTFPPEYTGVQDIIDIWEKQKVSGYFVRHPNSFELKATYRKDHRMAILVIWMDYFQDGINGHGVFPNACYWLARKYNLDVAPSDDRDIFDYGWTNMGHLNNMGIINMKQHILFIRGINRNCRPRQHGRRRQI
jgi:hypothetical protein